jgi:hypothetical protein
VYHPFHCLPLAMIDVDDVECELNALASKHGTVAASPSHADLNAVKQRLGADLFVVLIPCRLWKVILVVSIAVGHLSLVHGGGNATSLSTYNREGSIARAI